MQAPTQILTSFSVTSAYMHMFRALRDSDLFRSRLSVMALVAFLFFCFLLSLVSSWSGSCTLFSADKFAAVDRAHLKDLNHLL